MTDLSGLSDLTLLRNLNLAVNPLENLDGLKNLPSLSELDLVHTKVRDLRPLSELPMLTRVTVSADMLPLAADPEAHYDVVVVR